MPVWAAGRGVAVVGLVLAVGHRAAGQEAEGVSFVRQIAPILAAQCLDCHGPDEAKGDYRVDTFEGVVNAGAALPAVVAGEPTESELFVLITETSAADRMPKDADALAAEQVELIRRWIVEGAKFDGPAVTTPLLEMLPEVEHPAAPAVYPAALAVTALAVSGDGALVATAGYHEILVFDAETGSPVRRIGNVPRRVFALAFSPDGSLIAAAGGTPGESGEARLYETATGRLVATLGRYEDAALTLAFSPDGSTLAVGGVDRRVYLYDVTGVREKRERRRVVIEAHSDWVTAVAFSADGSRIASASRDKTARVSNAKDGAFIAAYRGHERDVRDIAFTENGEEVISLDSAGGMHRWQASSGDRRRNPPGVGAKALRLLVAGSNLYVGCDDGGVRVIDLGANRIVATYTGPGDWVYAAALHGGTGRLFAGDRGGRVRVWAGVKQGENQSGAVEPMLLFQSSPGVGPERTDRERRLLLPVP